MIILISAEKITSVKRKKWRKKGHGYKQFVIVDIGYQEPKSTKKKKRLRQKDLINYINHYGLN